MIKLLSGLIGKTIESIHTSIVKSHDYGDSSGWHEDTAVRITCTDGTIVTFATKQDYDISVSGCSLAPIILKSDTGSDFDYTTPTWLKIQHFTANNPHNWEPVDTQGYVMQCTKCGLQIHIHTPKQWDENIDGECRK